MCTAASAGRMDQHGEQIIFDFGDLNLHFKPLKNTYWFVEPGVLILLHCESEVKRERLITPEFWHLNAVNTADLTSLPLGVPTTCKEGQTSFDSTISCDVTRCEIRLSWRQSKLKCIILSLRLHLLIFVTELFISLCCQKHNEIRLEFQSMQMFFFKTTP